MRATKRTQATRICQPQDCCASRAARRTPLTTSSLCNLSRRNSLPLLSSSVVLLLAVALIVASLCGITQLQLIVYLPQPLLQQMCAAETK